MQSGFNPNRPLAPLIEDKSLHPPYFLRTSNGAIKSWILEYPTNPYWYCSRSESSLIFLPLFSHSWQTITRQRAVQHTYHPAPPPCGLHLPIKTSCSFSPGRIPIISICASGATACRSITFMLGILGTNTSPPCICSRQRISVRPVPGDQKRSCVHR